MSAAAGADLAPAPSPGVIRPMTADYRPHRALAERAAVAAGRLLVEQQARVTAREKGPGDLVTAADSASQRLIAAMIAAEHPDHAVLGEEDGLVADPANPWRWVVDPLDGTVNYAHGFPFWSVSIALEHAGELVVGVVHDPVSGRMFAASRGAGATCDGRPLRVSAATSLGSSLISTGFPTAFAADSPRQLALLDRMATGTHSVRRTGSAALNLAHVAAGHFEVFYATSIHPWDVAAGVVLVVEAGGRVSELDGGPHRLDGGGLLATNGHVHAEAVAACVGAWPALAGR